MNIFLPINFSICFGCSKEPSHWDGSFEYPQHMFWLRIKKSIFLSRTQFTKVLYHIQRVILYTKIFSVNLWIFSYPLVKTLVLAAQKNRLIETVLLSTHNIRFGWEIRKLSLFTHSLKACLQLSYISSYSTIKQSVACSHHKIVIIYYVRK